MLYHSHLLLAVQWILLISFQTTTGQHRYTNFRTNPTKNLNATWCTVSAEEQKKCERFKAEVLDNEESFGKIFMRIECKQAFDKEQCMNWLDQEEAHMTSLDPGEVYIAGMHHSLVPIMQEVYTPGVNLMYAVAVVKKNSLPDVRSLRDLRGKRTCFPGVGKMAGWVIPIQTLMDKGGLEVIDCNNPVKSAINYFGPSCAIDSLTNRYNPLGDNSDHLCKLCTGVIPGGICTASDPYAGYEGAFKCLVEAGEIAFLLHTTVQQMTSTDSKFQSLTKDGFELLCLDGTRRSVDNYMECNWGSVPPRAVISSSAMGADIHKYQSFLRKAVSLFSKTSSPPNFNNASMYGNYNQNENYSGFSYTYENRNPAGVDNNDNDPPGVRPLEGFQLFESTSYGNRLNLIFSDTAVDLVSIPSKDQGYLPYLAGRERIIQDLRRCTISQMRLCVVSLPEMLKCLSMSRALKSQQLQPKFECVQANSQIDCMRLIRKRDADIAVFDGGDIYTAGHEFGLIPIMAEVYDLPTPEYYAVAVAKVTDPSTQLTYLKNKYTCHTGINTAAGWIYPMAYLISNDWIRAYGCDSIHAAAEYFIKSCIPGALSIEYNIGLPFDNMCGLCHGTTSHLCRRDATEDFYGHTGAFRCLVEGGGDVAFVKHTTVFENTDSKKKDIWARDTLMNDFELLCPDGTRKSTQNYENCNLGKIKANAIVTRGKLSDDYYDDDFSYRNTTEINAYINLLNYTQQFFGRKRSDEFIFSMFMSEPPYSDLIFQDAARKLVVIPIEEREYSSYLGRDFMRAQRVVNCNAGASAIHYSIFASVLTNILAFTLGR